MGEVGGSSGVLHVNGREWLISSVLWKHRAVKYIVVESLSIDGPPGCRMVSRTQRGWNGPEKTFVASFLSRGVIKLPKRAREGRPWNPPGERRLYRGLFLGLS